MSSPWVKVLDELENDIASFEASLAHGAFDEVVLTVFESPTDAGTLPPEERDRANHLQLRLNQVIENAEREMQALASAVTLTHSPALREADQPPVFFDFQA